MERLKNVLKRIKQDKEEGLHPFVDPKEAKRLEKKLRQALKLSEADREPGSSNEEAGGDEESLNEDHHGNKETGSIDASGQVIGDTETEGTNEIANELRLFLLGRQNRGSRAASSMVADGDLSKLKGSLSDEEIETLR